MSTRNTNEAAVRLPSVFVLDHLGRFPDSPIKIVRQTKRHVFVEDDGLLELAKDAEFYSTEAGPWMGLWGLGVSATATLKILIELGVLEATI